jgi:hypothetical protein
MSAGEATALVRDGTREGQDPPTTALAPPPTEEKSHWIDVDRLPVGQRRQLSWPLRRLPPSYPGPPPPSRRRIALGVAVACCSLFVGLAVFFGHVKPLYTPALPPGEVVGDVVGVTGHTFVVEYSIPGQYDSYNVTAGSGSVSNGQAVVVRYAGDGTVVSTSAPSLRLGAGFLGATSGVALITCVALRFGLRAWSARDRIKAEHDATDYRDDAWSGTSYSA